MKMKMYFLKGFIAITFIALFFFITNPSYGQLLLNENFDYPVGSTLTSQGWTAQTSGAGTNPITVVSDNLTYPLYGSSGVGNKVSLATTGEDDYKTFGSINSGNLYVAALIKVTSAKLTGDYFLHFNTGTNYFARLFVKLDTNTNKLSFGLMKNAGGTTPYTNADYELNTTYLIVLKYTFVSGSALDTAYLYINPSPIFNEPNTPVMKQWINTDATSITSISLRQGASTAAPTVEIDGIRVAQTWTDAVGASSTAPPVWTSGWPKIQNILPTSFEAKVNIDIPGIAYYVVLPNNSTAPNATQVKSGLDANNISVPANMKGTITCTLGNTEYSSTVSGLTSNTTYNIYFVAEDNNNNLQANPTMVLATTASSSTPPTLTSLAPTSITYNSAVLGGNITSDGGSPILSRGTIWSTTSGVTISNNYLEEGGNTTGTFSHIRSSLPSKAQIFYKAFATNAQGTTLSSESSFFTLAEKPVSHVTAFSAIAISTTEINLSWTPTFGTDGYIVIHRVGSSAPTGMPVDATGYSVGSTIGNGTVSAILTNGSSSSTTISGLSPMTQYTFIIIPFGYDGANFQTFSYNINPIIPQASTSTFAPPAVVYTWNTTKGSWTDANNWNPVRTTPETNDILKFNNGLIDTVTNVPTQTIGQIIVENNTNLFLQSGGTNTLSISGYTGIDLSVENGSQLNIIGSSALTIKLLANAIGSIYGTINFAGGAHKLDAIDALSIEFNSGSSLTQDIGCTGNIFTNSGTSNIVTFKNGSTFIQKAGSNPFALTAPNSKVIFEPSSLFKLNANLTPSFSGRTYGNFELDFVGANSTVSGASAVVLYNLTITNGTMNFNMTANPGHSIKGNISVASGGTLNFAPTSGAIINFDGTALQTINSVNPIKINRNDTIIVNNTNGLVINDSVIINGTLRINDGIITLNNSITIDTLGQISTYSINEYIVLANNSKLYKRFPITGGTFVYPIGENLPYSKYLPVSVNFNSGTFTANNNYMGVDFIATKHPNDLSTGNYIKRYWRIESSGISNFSANLNFQYDLNDVEGSENLIYCKNFSSNPVEMYSVADFNNHQLNATNVELFGEFGGGEDLSNKTLTLNLILEGLFNGIDMNPVQDDMGNHIGQNSADYINVELHNSLDPSIIAASFTNQILGTDGVCQINIPPSLSDAYYIVIKHRNSITTWSANPVSFSAQNINYNFTDSETKAYGDNLKQVAPGIYAIFVGDVNQDEVVDLFDLVDMDYDFTNGTVAYIVYDINGDGVVDLFDLITMDENFTNGVVAIYP